MTKATEHRGAPIKRVELMKPVSSLEEVHVHTANRQSRAHKYVPTDTTKESFTHTFHYILMEEILQTVSTAAAAEWHRELQRVIPYNCIHDRVMQTLPTR